MSDGLWFTKDANGFIGWFRIEESKGTLRTGATGGSFTVTVVNPADSASSIPTVTESTTKAGLYKFTVPSSFLLTHGVGTYGVVVEVNVISNPKVIGTFSAILKVNTKDFEDLVGADASAIAEAIWEYIPATVVAGSFGALISEMHEIKVIASATVTAGSSTSSINTDLTEADDYFNGYWVHIINDTNPTSGIDIANRKIDQYLNTDGEIVFVEDIPFTPSIGSRVFILSNHDERSGRV